MAKFRRSQPAQRAMLIVNPHATSTTPRRRDLIAHALAGVTALRVEHTGGRGHAIELAAKAVHDGADLVVVHGGDGTVNEAVNGLLAEGGPLPDIALAIVPGGSTNVFARAIGIDADPLEATEQILEAWAARRSRVVSMGLADDRYFTFNAGLGIDAEVVRSVEERRTAGRAISNQLHLQRTLAQFFASDRRHPRLTLELPGADPVPGAHLVFASNVSPWTYLGSRPVRTNPGTGPGTGLGIFALTSMRTLLVLRLARQLLFRQDGPAGRPVIRADDVAEAHVTAVEPVGLQVDGDYLGERVAVTFRAVPDALRVLV